MQEWLTLPYCPDHKARLENFIESAPYDSACVMYGFLHWVYRIIVLYHRQPIVCGKLCYLFNC